jgi:hypothetical protein
MSGNVSFVILPIWDSEGLLYLDVSPFLKIGDIFCNILLNMLSMPLVCISSPFFYAYDS